MRFFPDLKYKPNFKKYKELQEQEPGRIIFSLYLRTTINDKLEAVYESDEATEALIQHYKNDDVTDNDIIEADIRIIKINPNGIGHKVLEHGIYDMEAKVTVWQNPKLNPFEQ